MKAIRADIVPYSQPDLPFAVLRGPMHQTQALAAKMERRGDIKRLGRGVCYVAAGQAFVALPYRPIRTLAEIRDRARAKIVCWTVIGVAVGGSSLAAAWEARYIILNFAFGATLFAGSCYWLATRMNHAGACPGLHCSGCRR